MAAHVFLGFGIEGLDKRDLFNGDNAFSKLNVLGHEYLVVNVVVGVFIPHTHTGIQSNLLLKEIFEPDFFETISPVRLRRWPRYDGPTMDDVTRPNPNAPLGGDILHGADGIAAFLYGNAKHRRKVYNLVETNRLPHFRLGAVICARKSVLHSWIKTQEERSHRPNSL
jgi:hypothetical protein